jgi:SAM-dependent methyltransferase
MNNNSKNWDDAYSKYGLGYPSENLIRIFKGRYPNLNLSETIGYDNKRILDVGCGLGRNTLFLSTLGFEKVSGVDICEETIQKARQISKDKDLKINYQVGSNNNIPFGNDMFDFLVSWNVCYYMDEKMDFKSHVKEYARVLKSGGVFVFSIPMVSCFIYKDAIENENGFMKITSDYFNIRNNTYLKFFNSKEDIILEFGDEFDQFVMTETTSDFFGLQYDWFIGYCIKK